MSNYKELFLRRLNPDPQQVPPEIVAAVQALFEETPGYFEAISGRTAKPQESHESFYSLPAPFQLEQKLCFGYYCTNKLVGFSEVLKGHPHPHTAYIGLHLISERYQGLGWGQQCYRLLEAELHHLPITRLRLGVALNNSVEGFWAKMGFQRLPGYKDVLESSIESQVFEMEKEL